MKMDRESLELNVKDAAARCGIGLTDTDAQAVTDHLAHWFMGWLMDEGHADGLAKGVSVRDRERLRNQFQETAFPPPPEQDFIGAIFMRVTATDLEQAVDRLASYAEKCVQRVGGEGMHSKGHAVWVNDPVRTDNEGVWRFRDGDEEKGAVYDWPNI